MLSPKSKKLTEKMHLAIKENLARTIDQFRDKILGELILEKVKKVAVFPENCRFLYQDKKTVVAVIEQKPQVRTVTIDEMAGEDEDDDDGEDVPPPVRLSFPYVVFLVVFHCEAFLCEDSVGNGQEFSFTEIKVSFRNTPLTDWQDRLGENNLPNYAPSHITSFPSMCLGGMANNHWDNLRLAVHDVLTHFWSSVWTGELNKRISPLLKSVAAWEQNTKRDPTFILAVDWKEKNRLGDLVLKIINYHGFSSLHYPEQKLLLDRVWQQLRKNLTSLAVQGQLEQIIEEETKRAIAVLCGSITGKKALAEVTQAFQKMYGEIPF